MQIKLIDGIFIESEYKPFNRLLATRDILRSIEKKDNELYNANIEGYYKTYFHIYNNGTRTKTIRMDLGDGNRSNFDIKKELIKEFFRTVHYDYSRNYTIDFDNY